jgi:predicted nucleic acid-binding protein
LNLFHTLEKNSVLLTNDKKAGEFAEDLGVKVLDIISFLLLCQEINLLSTSEIEHILDSLKKYDYMEFNREQKKLLL